MLLQKNKHNYLIILLSIILIAMIGLLTSCGSAATNPYIDIKAGDDVEVKNIKEARFLIDEQIWGSYMPYYQDATIEEANINDYAANLPTQQYANIIYWETINLLANQVINKKIKTFNFKKNYSTEPWYDSFITSQNINFLLNDSDQITFSFNKKEDGLIYYSLNNQYEQLSIYYKQVRVL